VGLRVGLDAEKFPARAGTRTPAIIQPAAQRYTTEISRLLSLSIIWLNYFRNLIMNQLHVFLTLVLDV
jgi:hypothetical protein